MNLMMTLARVVRRGRLPGEEERPGPDVETRIFPEPVVEDHDAQGVEQLPLVLVDALDLTVEDAVRVNHLPGRRLEPLGEPRLALTLGLPEHLAEARVLGQWREPPQLVEAGDPASARRVWLWFRSEGLTFPLQMHQGAQVRWVEASYTAIQSASQRHGLFSACSSLKANQSVSEPVVARWSKSNA